MLPPLKNVYCEHKENPLNVTSDVSTAVIIPHLFKKRNTAAVNFMKKRLKSAPVPLSFMHQLRFYAKNRAFLS